MTKKLLHKTSQYYLLFSFLILLIAAALFYYSIEKLYIDDADESLLLGKKEFIQDIAPTLKITEIRVWNKMNRDVKIEKVNYKITKDTIILKSYYDKLIHEQEPYRVLTGNITIEGQNFNYTSKINLVETEDLIQNIALLFTAVILVLLLGLYLINQQLSLKLWQPFYDNLHQIENFEIDKNIKPKFIKSNIEEFNRLNNATHKLILNNSIIYKNQREFIDNAAHELQTPLAIFKTELDTLLQRSDITLEQAELLGNLNDASDRLSKLNKNLLLLSKLENYQYLDIATVSINEIVNKQLPFFKEQALSKNIQVDCNIEKNIIIESNPVLVEIVISNLFLNALKHNIINGKISIETSGNSILFSNTGTNNALDQTKIFQRFSKFSTTGSGNGLGLSIVQKITKLNKWNIKYNFKENFHFFELQF